jgi:Raf kinase inhibitor-like YbhB/YbcL family protein
MRSQLTHRWRPAAFMLIFMITALTATAQGGKAMELTSAAFADGGKIPQDYVMPGAGGKNISLPLKWSGAPAGAQAFALSIVDPHPVARDWVHWLVVNLPADTAALEAGASGRKMPTGALELHNSWGKPGYGGPQPPPGTGDHPYVVTLYALNTAKLDVKPAADLKGFTKALEGKILDTTKITGYYGR